MSALKDTFKELKTCFFKGVSSINTLEDKLIKLLGNLYFLTHLRESKYTSCKSST
jgi:hypothetical protein